MTNTAVDQFARTLFTMLMPFMILAGIVNALTAKRRKARPNSNNSTRRPKSGWADDLVLAPWWVSFGLAILAFVVLPRLIPVTTFLAPVIGIFLLCLSAISILHSWKTGRMLDQQTG